MMKRKPKKRDDFSFRPFGQLKSAISDKSIRTAPETKPPAPPPLPSDHDIFLDAMKDVRVIPEFRDLPVQKPQIKTPRKQPHPDKEVLDTLDGIAKGKLPIRLSDTQEYVEWVNPDYCTTKSIAKKLHGGSFAVQDMLDLHGFTEEEADEHVSKFLRNALLHGLGCVKIIHGRGLKSPDRPVLKSALAAWLTGRYRNNVVAFASARQCDGGLGAVYVLLKAKR
jgi:DNA-nicking Smr family endonuclease